MTEDDKIKRKVESGMAFNSTTDIHTNDTYTVHLITVKV